MKFFTKRGLIYELDLVETTAMSWRVSSQRTVHEVHKQTLSTFEVYKTVERATKGSLSSRHPLPFKKRIDLAWKHKKLKLF